jgi:hypothetical protein
VLEHLHGMLFQIGLIVFLTGTTGYDVPRLFKEAQPSMALLFCIQGCKRTTGFFSEAV